jgi:hypothetical protein
MVANEMARMDELKAYNNEDIILTLPNSLTMSDISYLAIYNPDAQKNLGHISFNVTGQRYVKI